MIQCNTEVTEEMQLLYRPDKNIGILHFLIAELKWRRTKKVCLYFSLKGTSDYYEKDIDSRGYRKRAWQCGGA